MSWQTQMVPIVRGLIFDMDSPCRYSDTRLEELIATAGALAISEIAFSTSYTIDLNAISITPDPADAGDADFIALVSLKAACMISGGEFRDAANAAVSVKDGPSFVDTKDRAKMLQGVAQENCKNYQRASMNYKIGDGSLGRAIVGPYATGALPDSGRRFS